GRLTAWLAQHEAYAVLVRPDFYVFGSAATATDVPALLDDLRAQLDVPYPTTTHESGDGPMPETPVIHPKFHHFNLKTTRLQEMVDYYRVLVGAEVIHQDEMGAWLSNDKANHRIALLAFPNFTDDPDKDSHTGLHHSAFEYSNFEDLNASYLRLREAGIVP